VESLLLGLDEEVGGLAAELTTLSQALTPIMVPALPDADAGAVVGANSEADVLCPVAQAVRNRLFAVRTLRKMVEDVRDRLRL